MDVEREPVRSGRGGEAPLTLLRTLVVCDLVDSTTLVEQIGDRAAAQLIRRHDQMARLALKRHGGQEIDKTDGFLLVFERPIDAVLFALEYQHELRALGKETEHPLVARVGIHVGEVVVWDNSAADVATGAKPVEVEGLAKPVAARLMGLARPGQILLSGIAYSLARRGAHDVGRPALPARWVAHGRYRLKGMPEPVAVFEVGEPGIAPLRAPLATEKAWPARSWWQHPLSLAGGAVALIASAVLFTYSAIRSEPTLAFNERDWVVICDVADPSNDEVLDTTLATMFRIGLEQSRFVNIVPEGRVRQALTLMQRSSATRIDREVGSEIALREHARAVILPTVTQYGQTLRLTAELIDPNGVRTVAVKTAEASRSTGLLPALDKLVRELRASLGESLSQIQSSHPLEQVTTANLQALRSYSHARRFAQQGDIEQALSLLSYATELDPHFASAYAFMGSLFFTQQRYADAHSALDKALSAGDRLTERERLYIRGQVARFADPRTMAELWQTYAQLFPDQGVGQNNLGNVRYALLLDYYGAEVALTEVAASRVPLRNFAMQTLGHVLLAEEKLEKAEEQFRAAEALSPAVESFGLSDVLVVAGRFNEAARYLESTSRQTPTSEVERTMRRATLMIARDEIAEASAAIASVLPQAAQLQTPNPRWRAMAALVALEASEGHLAAARTRAAQHLAELSSAVAQPSVHSLETMEHLLYAASWGARLGLASEARQALTLARRDGTLELFPVRARLAELAEGEVQLAAGRPLAVISQLQSTSNDGELWELHELRARALRALGDQVGETKELRWLVSHGGLAHAEWIDQLLGQQARAIALQSARRQLSEQSGRK